VHIIGKYLSVHINQMSSDEVGGKYETVTNRPP